MNLAPRLREVYRPRSIRRQLIIGVAGVHMILMVSFVYDLVERQQAFLFERARTRTLYQAEVLAAGAVPQLITRDSAGLQEILHSMAKDSSVRLAMVSDAAGLLRGHSESHKVGMHLADERSRKVLSGEVRARIFQEGETTVWAAAPILSHEDLLGWAFVRGDLRVDEAQLAAVHRTALIYVVMAVVAGTVFATLLANGITRQLRLLLAGTKRLAQENLDQPVPIVTGNDVGVVAKAFNDAVKRLADERATVRQTRERLEAEIRERRRAEAELQAANRTITTANDRLRDFAHAASHDLQEPLRAVSSYSEMLQRRYTGQLDSDADEFIGYIHQGAERMQHLIRALLAYSRAGASGDQEPNRVETNGALNAALQNLATAIEESGAKVEAPSLPPVKAHDIAIVQLFQNLIGNAIKYATPACPPHIRISAERTEHECVFSIADNGIGIAPEHHERIFRIFRRAHGQQYPGTGVGLAICTRIVERYGGRIWVDSEAGQGSTFHFTLPAVNGESPQRSRAAQCGSA